METIDCVQRSEEWYRARIGMVTASCFKLVLSKGAARQMYMNKLIDERLTGESSHSYANAAMRNGTAREPDALATYEKEVSLVVKAIGFLKLNKDVGCSPDGLVGDTGGVEIKCPTAPTHGKYITQDKLPSTYKAQVQGNLWITGRLWWDFVSYYPEKPLFIKRVYQDEPYIQKLNAKVNVFVTELKAELEKRSTDMNFQTARSAPGTIVQMQGIATTWDYKPQGTYGPYALADILDTAGETQKVLISGSSQSVLPGPEVQNQPGLWGIKYDANTQKLKGYFNGYAQQGQAPQTQAPPPQQALPPQSQLPHQAPQNYSQAPQNQPQSTQAPQGGRNATGVSIERQCVVKAVCEVAGRREFTLPEVLNWCVELHSWVETGTIPYSQLASANPIQDSAPSGDDIPY